MNLKERANKLKVDIPAVFLAMKEKDAPIAAKILAGITITYTLSPIDLIPDFIPILGYLDDIIILPALIALVVKLIPAEVFARCRVKSADLWVNGKPKKWYFAIPIIAVWVIVILWIVSFLY